MPVPELVVADTAYKAYPGGVIALKATEWMAATRGSLTSASDTLASTGSRVRDTQTVTTSIRDDVFTAYAEALDTLEIPFADIPIEAGLGYDLLVSYRCPGEWDVTNTDTLLNGCNHHFRGVGAVGFHGTTFEPDEDNAAIDDGDYLARTPHYVVRQVAGPMALFDVQTDQVLVMRFFSQSGTTAEWLIDQIIFLPNMSNYFGPPINGWDTDDFLIGPSGGYQANAFSAIDPVDGADGGDDNGKFTWCPAPHDQASFMGAGGDYQRVADGDDAEYLVEVNEDDGLLIENSGSPSSEPRVHGYSLHGVRYREEQEWTRDEFSRSTGFGTSVQVGDWGNTPEGYGWACTGSTSAVNPQAGTNGSKGIMRCRSSSATIGAKLGEPGNGRGADLRLFDQFEISGIFKLTAAANWDTDPGPISNAFGRLQIRLLGGNLLYTLRVNMPDTGGQSENWEFGYVVGSTFTSLSGPHDISSWFAEGVDVGFRIEVKRHIIRVKLWEASGGEPGTWAYEDFRRVRSGATTYTYPYGDDPRIAMLIYQPNYIDLIVEFGLVTASAVSPIDIEWDDIVVETNPYGDPADMTTRTERPEGSSLGDITIPYGAAHLVYWGSRDWTEVNGGGDFGVALGARCWNETTAAELQRADGEFWYFRSVHGGAIDLTRINMRAFARGD